MSFVLTEDQEMLRDTAMAFTRDEMPVSHFRALRDRGANGHDPDIRRKLAELGFFGVIISGEPGGEHFGLAGLGQVLEAQGRVLAATPLLQSALIAASLFTLGAAPAMAAHWLARIAAGETTFALALDEGAHHAPERVATSARVNGDAIILDGHKRYVPDAHHADRLFVVAREAGAPGDTEGLSVLLVPRDADGLVIQPLDTVDAHGAAHVVLEGVRVSAAERIGAPGAAWGFLEPVLDRARIGLAAEMLGTAEAAFEMTLAYLQERKQFGQLIGSFQALQHRAARMFTELELTRSCVAAALSAVDEGRDDIAQLASLAKARADETVHLVTNEAVQMHGGIGMTDAHDAGLYLKRARVQAALYGGASYHRDRFARLNGF